MATRIPFTTLPTFVSTPAPPTHLEIKGQDAHAVDTAEADENVAPSTVLSEEDDSGRSRVVGCCAAYAASSFLTLPPSYEDDGSSDGEAEADERGSNDDSDETMLRFLAFANRGRASGSGLPAILAHLNRAVEDADDTDAATAESFVSGVAGVIRQEREIQAAVSEILYAPEDVTIESAASSGNQAESVDNNAGEPVLEEARVFEEWLARRAAFKALGARRLDAAGTEGMSTDKVASSKKMSAKPLRRKLLTYLAEQQVYLECSQLGIEYPQPYAIYVAPDPKSSSRAYVVETGILGVKSSRVPNDD
ncbi:hypothetical protein C8Q77DRAFT_1051886 [Trametes polyzona]|nr:hypothetical protein C8Q77DRAFT_1051886 [Trametes polyzona]